MLLCTPPVGTSSNQLQMRMKKKRVTANGTMRAPVGPMPVSTWFWMAPTTVSQSSCTRFGTPLVIRRRTKKPAPTTMMPANAVAQIVSTLKVRPATVSAAPKRLEQRPGRAGQDHELEQGESEHHPPADLAGDDDDDYCDRRDGAQADQARSHENALLRAGRAGGVARHRGPRHAAVHRAQGEAGDQTQPHEGEAQQGREDQASTAHSAGHDVAPPEHRVELDQRKLGEHRL